MCFLSCDGFVVLSRYILPLIMALDVFRNNHCYHLIIASKKTTTRIPFRIKSPRPNGSIINFRLFNQSGAKHIPACLLAPRIIDSGTCGQSASMKREIQSQKTLSGVCKKCEKCPELPSQPTVLLAVNQMHRNDSASICVQLSCAQSRIIILRCAKATIACNSFKIHNYRM